MPFLTVRTSDETAVTFNERDTKSIAIGIAIIHLPVVVFRIIVGVARALFVIGRFVWRAFSFVFTIIYTHVLNEKMHVALRASIAGLVTVFGFFALASAMLLTLVHFVGTGSSPSQGSPAAGISKSTATAPSVVQAQSSQVAPRDMALPQAPQNQIGQDAPVKVDEAIPAVPVLLTAHEAVPGTLLATQVAGPKSEMQAQSYVIDADPLSPSFDCSKATQVSEKLICSDRVLSKLDVQMAALYSLARSHAADAGQLKSEQVRWLTESVQHCADKACVASAYEARIAQLATR